MHGHSTASVHKKARQRACGRLRTHAFRYSTDESPREDLSSTLLSCLPKHPTPPLSRIPISSCRSLPRRWCWLRARQSTWGRWELPQTLTLDWAASSEPSDPFGEGRIPTAPGRRPGTDPGHAHACLRHHAHTEHGVRSGPGWSFRVLEYGHVTKCSDSIFSPSPKRRRRETSPKRRRFVVLSTVDFFDVSHKLVFTPVFLLL
jgi:hypothetical protein